MTKITLDNIDQIKNIEFEEVGLHHDDGDGYISYAEWSDGTPLNDEELDQLTNDFMYYYGERIESERCDNLAALGDHYKDIQDGN